MQTKCQIGFFACLPPPFFRENVLEKFDHSQCSRLPENDRGVLHERSEIPLLDNNALQELQGRVLLGGAGARVGQVEILDPLECVLWFIKRRRRYVYLMVPGEGGDFAGVNPQLRNNHWATRLGTFVVLTRDIYHLLYF